MSENSSEKTSNGSSKEEPCSDSDSSNRSVSHSNCNQKALELANGDPDVAKEWILKNYEHLESYKLLKEDLCKILVEYSSEIDTRPITSDNVLLFRIRRLIDDMYLQVMKYYVNLGEFSETELLMKLGQHQKNVFNVLDEYEQRIEDDCHEVRQCKDDLAQIEVQLNTLKELRESDQSNNENTVDEEKFLEDLKTRASEMLQSSMVEELDRERLRSSKLEESVQSLTRQRLEAEESCMRDIAEIFKMVDINNKIEDALVSMLNISDAEKSANIEDCRKVVGAWKKLIKQAMEEEREEIETFSKELMEIEEATADAEEKKDEAWNKYEKFKDMEEKANAEIKVLQKKIKLHEQVSTEQQQVVEEHQRNQEAIDKVAELEAEYQKLTKQGDEYQKSIKTAQAMISICQDELIVLSEQLRDLREKNTQLKQEKSSMGSAVTSAKGQSDNHERCLQDLEELEKKVVEFGEIIEEYEEENKYLHNVIDYLMHIFPLQSRRMYKSDTDRGSPELGTPYYPSKKLFPSPLPSKIPILTENRYESRKDTAPTQRAMNITGTVSPKTPYNPIPRNWGIQSSSKDQGENVIQQTETKPKALNRTFSPVQSTPLQGTRLPPHYPESSPITFMNNLSDKQSDKTRPVNETVLRHSQPFLQEATFQQNGNRTSRCPVSAQENMATDGQRSSHGNRTFERKPAANRTFNEPNPHLCNATFERTPPQCSYMPGRSGASSDRHISRTRYNDRASTNSNNSSMNRTHSPHSSSNEFGNDLYRYI